MTSFAQRNGSTQIDELFTNIQLQTGLAFRDADGAIYRATALPDDLQPTIDVGAELAATSAARRQLASDIGRNSTPSSAKPASP